VNASTAGFFVRPIRVMNTSYVLVYDPSTSEITYSVPPPVYFPKSTYTVFNETYFRLIEDWNYGIGPTGFSITSPNTPQNPGGMVTPTTLGNDDPSGNNSNLVIGGSPVNLKIINPARVFGSGSYTVRATVTFTSLQNDGVHWQLRQVDGNGNHTIVPGLGNTGGAGTYSGSPFSYTTSSNPMPIVNTSYGYYLRVGTYNPSGGGPNSGTLQNLYLAFYKE
jgi:hypothetical protein